MSQLIKCHKRIKLELKHDQQKGNATNKCIKPEMHPINIWNKKNTSNKEKRYQRKAANKEKQ